MDLRDGISVWPVSGGASGVLLLGGSFDPVHLGHVELGVAARDAVFGDEGWLVLVPAARSPLKGAGTTAADRVAMVGLAIEGVDRAAIWTDEVDRASAGDASYWVDTLRRAREVSGGVAMRFVIGTDQAASFHWWRSYREILGMCEPVVLARAPVVTTDALRTALDDTGVWSADEIERWLSWVVEVGLREVSSTAVRAELARGGAPPEVDARVLGYVRERGLYVE